MKLINARFIKTIYFNNIVTVKIIDNRTLSSYIEARTLSIYIY